jgi:hypothetical protein
MKCPLIVFALLLLLTFFYSITNYVHAQTYIILARTDDGRWRYYDLEGKVIIDKKFPVYYPFTKDGVAVVGDEKLYKLIDSKGEEINTEIPVHIWDDHHYIKAWFSDGLIVTRHRTKFGCLDTSGRIAIPYKYYDIEEFKDGHAIARIKKDFFVLNKKGREIQINDTTIKKAKPFYENLAAYAAKNGKSGFIDTTGRVVIPAQFEGVGNFSNGLAWARADNGLIGFINSEGKWVIPPSFDAVNSFDKQSGLAKVKSKIKKQVGGGTEVGSYWSWMHINASGEIQKFDILSEDIDEFSEGLAMCKKGKRFGFINNKGEWVIQPKFGHVREFKDDVACAKENGLWGVIDKQGNWILTPRFEVLKDVSRIK